MANFFRDDSFTSDHTANLLNKGIIDGDVDQSDNSATATGTGSVAASGGSHVNAATGANSVANTGGGDVNQAFGKGAQIVSHSGIGQNAANSPGAIQAHDTFGGAFNSGVNTGAQVGGSAQNLNVGHHINSANVDGHADGTVFNFGGGHVDNASNNLVFHGAVSAHGPASNVSDNTADHGSAVAGHDASGFDYTDNHIDDTETNLSRIDHSSNVNEAQGHSSAHAGQHFQPQHLDVTDSHIGDTEINDFFHG
jgi:hypothetical protein